MLEKRWLIFNFLHPRISVFTPYARICANWTSAVFHECKISIIVYDSHFLLLSISMVYLILSPLTFLVEKMMKSGNLPFVLLPCAQSLVKK